MNRKTKNIIRWYIDKTIPILMGIGFLILALLIAYYLDIDPEEIGV